MPNNYHEGAQKFIKSSKAMGYPVKAENGELIAYPPGTPKKSKLVDKVSDAMSYPARRKAQKAMLKADNDVRDIKMVRETKGLEPVPNDERSPLFRARANVSNLKAQRESLK